MAVKSAERVLQILELLEGSPSGMTNKEISQRLGFAPSSTLGILQTMLDHGFLMADEGKRYSLGGKLVRLGDIAASRFDIGKIAGPYLRRLMNTLEETCFLAVLSGDEIVYIAKEWCEQTINTNANIGSRKPVYCTGLGKAFLAFLPRQESGEIIGQCGITLQDVNGEWVPEVGYLFERAYWHQGFATEAAIACKEYAFSVLGLDTVYSIIRDNNIASQNVAKRNGMTICGRIVKHYYGMDMPHLVYRAERDAK